MAESGYVVIATADWEAVLWTNKQHTARSFRDRGSRVLYVESMGLRAPTPRAGDVRRIARRVLRLVRPPVEVEPGIWRWSPPSVPLQRFALVRALNRLVCSALLQWWVRKLFPVPPVFWTYNPMTTALLRIPPSATLIYHCVDDVSAQPGMPAAQIRRAERDLVARADRTFVTSRELEATWSSVRGDVTYFPNCVDAEHFGRPDAGDDPLAGLRRPILGFVGAVADYKIESEALLEMVQRRPDWTLVVIGPREDRNDTITRLLAAPNVHYMGARRYAELPRYLQRFDVGLIPARLNDYTKSMFPMKFFEYLAAGIPVVATDIPALAEFGDVATLTTRDGMVAAIENVLGGDVPDAGVRQAAVDDNTYSARTRRMLASAGLH